MGTLRCASVLALSFGFAASSASAQGGCPNPALGPDVITGDIHTVASWGGLDGVGAYSVATSACNLGDAEVDWQATTALHPVIAGNIYRLENGRFEQLGLSWLLHGFAALQQQLCCDCIPAQTVASLGVGCGTTNSSGISGSQFGLGPRFEVDAHAGTFPFPFSDQGSTGNVLYKRIQIPHDGIDPALHPGARFFAEAQFVAADDAAAGNGNNNASYREMTVNGFVGSSWSFSLSGPTELETPAIYAWQAAEPSVKLEPVQVPSEGLFLVGSHCSDNGDGTWHYEYAVFNLNSDVSGGSFRVPVPSAFSVTNIGFHDVDHHSGEPFDGTDWVGLRNAEDVSWSTEDFATDPNANALRWGTLYNFRFDADAGPGIASATLGLFKPHTPDSIGVEVCAPECDPIAASEVVRLGTPPNPFALLPGQTSGPALGAVWDPVIDHGSFFPSATVDVLAVNPDGAQINVPTTLGTLLCNIPSQSFFFLTTPSTPIAVPIPASCDLAGIGVCAQGASFEAGVIELTNALDLTLGG